MDIMDIRQLVLNKTRKKPWNDLLVGDTWRVKVYQNVLHKVA